MLKFALYEVCLEGRFYMRLLRRSRGQRIRYMLKSVHMEFMRAKEALLFAEIRSSIRPEDPYCRNLSIFWAHVDRSGPAMY